MMDVDIIYAGLSAVTGVELITPKEATARNITSAPISIDKIFEYTHNQGALSFQHFLQHPPSEDSKLEEEDIKKSHSAEVDQLLKEAESEIMVEKKLNELKVATHKPKSEDSESEEDTGRNPSAKTKKRRGSQLQLLSEGIELKERSHPAKTKQKCDHKRGIKDKDTMEDTSDDTSNEWININVETITSQVIKIRIRKCYTIAQVKEFIEREDKTLPADKQKLFFKRKKLSDKVTVESIGIKDGDTLHLSMDVRGGGPGDDGLPIVLDDGFRDPSYNYDFTNERDDGKVYIRGGEIYHRPYGWYRHAVKVLDKYEDNTWLGERGTRTASTAGEWPVSYHGTTKEAAEGIASEGFDEKCGRRHKYGPGIYSTPDLSIAERDYAIPFTNNGKQYKIVFQNRVNPANLYKAYEDQYWIVSDSNIRPYGILLKEINNDCLIF